MTISAELTVENERTLSTVWNKNPDIKTMQFSKMVFDAEVFAIIKAVKDLICEELQERRKDNSGEASYDDALCEAISLVGDL